MDVQLLVSYNFLLTEKGSTVFVHILHVLELLNASGIPKSHASHLELLVPQVSTSQHIAGPGDALSHPVGLQTTRQQKSLKSISTLERTAEN